MIKRDEFRAAARIAVQNLIKHGDTDIFPLTFEGHAIFDKPDDFVDLVCEYDQKFDEYLARFPPSNSNALIPVSYYGFRWATQIDPIWNAHLLSCVVALSEKAEAARIRKDAECVFSYRYQPDEKSGDLFDRDFSWHAFMAKSLQHSESYEFVTTCDISEFYPRLAITGSKTLFFKSQARQAIRKKSWRFFPISRIRAHLACQLVGRPPVFCPS